jgi:phosphoglycerate dehydrogenase-like enzyme
MTKDTEGIIGREELTLLPPDAILVNVGRGPVVQEQVLYEALRDGRVGAAGLDVWYNYPEERDGRTPVAPANFPFHELENVVMSPHRAGGSDDTERLRVEHLARMLLAAARGEKLPNCVDLARGY